MKVILAGKKKVFACAVRDIFKGGKSCPAFDLPNLEGCRAEETSQ